MHYLMIWQALEPCGTGRHAHPCGNCPDSHREN